MLDENNMEIGQLSKDDIIIDKNLNNSVTNVVYLDDDKIMLENFHTIYSPYFTVFTTDSAKEAREIIDNNEIHIIISDQRMPETTGVEFFSSIIEIHPDPIRILLTAFTEIEVVIDAINQGHIYQYVRKPYIFKDMKKMLINAGEIYHLRKKRVKQTEYLDQTKEEEEEVKLV